MQRGVREERDASAGFSQGMVDRDQSDQAEEKRLDDFADPDAARAEDTVTFTKQVNHKPSIISFRFRFYRKQSMPFYMVYVKKR